MSFSTDTMKVVTFTAPYAVQVTQKPVPVPDEGEVVCRVLLSGMCGSDIHVFRGHDRSSAYGFTAGHEFVGEITHIGPSPSDALNRKFQIGQRVVAPFTISCGSCFYCVRGFTGRCEKSRLFGCGKLEGAQAEFVRVPMAATTLIPAPTRIPSHHLILMADIFPTGCIVVRNAWNMLTDVEKDPSLVGSLTKAGGVLGGEEGGAGGAVEGESKGRDGLTVCVIGCGPVGLCAIMAAKERFGTVWAIDPVQERLEMAERYGAIPIPLDVSPSEFMSAPTSHRGPDVVLEVVGNAQALTLALSLVRPCGVVSSCGVHTSKLEIEGTVAYGKGVRMMFGRCHARAMFDESLVLLEKIGRETPELLDDFVQKRIKLDDAAEYYKLFEERKIGKVVFDLQ